MIFVNIPALLGVVAVFILAWILHYQNDSRARKAAVTTFITVFALSLLYAIHKLSDLNDLEAMGRWLAFVLLANVYAALLALAFRVCQSLRSWKRK